MSTLLTYAITFLAGALTSYLVLRNNPKIKEKVDEITQKLDDGVEDQIKDKLKKKN